MYSTNWKYNYVEMNYRYLDYRTVSIDYQRCNCGISSKCTQSSQDMMAGCYPLEAFLQSALQCFYNQQCIDPKMTFKALNFSSYSTEYGKFTLDNENENYKLHIPQFYSNISTTGDSLSSLWDNANGASFSTFYHDCDNLFLIIVL
ncbi:unnamed protein product [Rotaria sp. Silwood2]|nr:unnamed protein product [Rotaria sp. Silwood2]CAF3007309.1 unnamed protein product [Rotaria sp. Silwood2]CAF3286846.1 unnamed protein product [Rotaria sp. Silwood2]CAF3423995.1 unnamed protein product [Rotaria sp. Silwood2]